MQKKFAIIDVETTGGRAARDKITEIAIVLHDGTQVLDRYETLINPEMPIPYGITELTGITNDMVADAPRFYEVAKKIVEMTEEAVFVAHNVRFDYSFIQEEFRRLGYTYSRKQLCTVRLARKAFPGLPSYSLSTLIRHFDLNVGDRHRAMGDTLATVDLFERILGKESGRTGLQDMINLGIRESLLPPGFTVDKIHALPEACGVYYFHDDQGAVIYVGKSINIRKRVAEHFSVKTEKARKLQEAVRDVSCEITGSEIVSLLLESHEIKRLRPSINRAQKVLQFPYVIHSFENEEGYTCFEIRKASKKVLKELQVIASYPTQSSAKGWLRSVQQQHMLCLKHCHLEQKGGPCFDYHLSQCLGACIGLENPASYNQRAQEALEQLDQHFLQPNFFILDKGRHQEEWAVILVEDGQYRGFGYAAANELDSDPEALKGVIKRYEHNPEVIRILKRFLGEPSRHKVLPF